VEARADREGLRGGAEGNTLSVFNPATGSGIGGVFLGMIYGIMSFVGWKAAASLGEETRDPYTSIPRALLAAWVLIGLVILFVISRRRPELVEAMGHAFSEAGADEPDTAQEDVRRRGDSEERRETIE
jgi:hypothetical protein